jgi:hypothetical protein
MQITDAPFAHLVHFGTVILNPLAIAEVAVIANGLDVVCAGTAQRRFAVDRDGDLLAGEANEIAVEVFLCSNFPTIDGENIVARLDFDIGPG